MIEHVAMFIVSMDHSPSEQLTDEGEWQTSAMVASEAGEHVELARHVAESLGQVDGFPRRWSKRKGVYQREFERHLSELLVEVPVHVRVASIRGKSLRHLVPIMIREMGLEGAVEQIEEGNKKRIRLGPFAKRTTVVHAMPSGDAEPTFFILPERQALHLLFVCYFVQRAHVSIAQLVNAARPNIDWVDWQMMPDRLPGGVNGPMALTFHALLSVLSTSGRVRGNFRTMTLRQADDDWGAALADNIAGCFSGKITSGVESVVVPPLTGRGSSFLWDIFDVDRAIA